MHDDWILFGKTSAVGKGESRRLESTRWVLFALNLGACLQRTCKERVSDLSGLLCCAVTLRVTDAL